MQRVTKIKKKLEDKTGFQKKQTTKTGFSYSKKCGELLQWPLPAYLCRSHQDRVYNFIQGPLQTTWGIGCCLQSSLLSPAAQFWQELPAAWHRLPSHLLPCFKRILQELLPGCPPSSAAHNWVNSLTDRLFSPVHTHWHKHAFSFFLLFLPNYLQKRHLVL